MRAGSVHDPREHHGLVRLELYALRERRDLALLHVVADAFPVFQRAVLAPDLAGLARHAAVGIDVALRNRYDESIYVLGHGNLLGSLGEGAQPTPESEGPPTR